MQASAFSASALQTEYMWPTGGRRGHYLEMMPNDHPSSQEENERKESQSQPAHHVTVAVPLQSPPHQASKSRDRLNSERLLC